MVSAPAPPLRVLAAALPVRLLARSLPVPLMPPSGGVGGAQVLDHWRRACSSPTRSHGRCRRLPRSCPPRCRRRRSRCRPPCSVSAPAPPLSMLLPPLPMMMLASVLPVPLMAAAPGQGQVLDIGAERDMADKALRTLLIALAGTPPTTVHRWLINVVDRRYRDHPKQFIDARVTNRAYRRPHCRTVGRSRRTRDMILIIGVADDVDPVRGDPPH